MKSTIKGADAVPACLWRRASTVAHLRLIQILQLHELASATAHACLNPMTAADLWD